MTAPVMKATLTAESDTARPARQPKKTTSAVRPYQLNQGTAIRNAHAGPRRLPDRYSVTAVGTPEQQQSGVRNPHVEATALARTTLPPR